MVTVGSDAWLEAFAAAVADIVVDAGGADLAAARLVVHHRIVDGPAWVVTIDRDVTVARADDADAADADVTFTWQADDAAAVAAGELSPLVPFQAGRLRVGGDLRRLSEAAELFARFPAVPPKRPEAARA